MTYGWETDIERELADDGHDERMDDDYGQDTALPPELLWCEPDPEDEDPPVMGGDVYDMTQEPY